MSVPARIRMDMQCPAIEVRRGEFVTVWLRVDDGSGFDRIQCELRVAPDGTPSVFLPALHLGMTRSFAEWTPNDPTPSHPVSETLAGEDRPAPRLSKSAVEGASVEAGTDGSEEE